MAKSEAKQITINEAVEITTGQPTPENLIPIHIDPPKRTRTKDGENSVFVTLSKEHYDKLSESSDGRPLGLWIRKLIERNFEKLV